MEPLCETCNFFIESMELSPDGKVVGECHRFPRMVFREEGIDKWLFPLHFETDWCGEYQEKA